MITVQSYNFIKTFAMIESVCITLMIALERWKISTLNRIFRQKWVDSVFLTQTVYFFQSSTSISIWAVWFGFNGNQFYSKAGFECRLDGAQEHASSFNSKPDFSYPMITLTEYNSTSPVRAPKIIFFHQIIDILTCTWNPISR